MVATVKTSNRWLGLLGAVAVILSAGVLATSSSTSQECYPGYCDAQNNSAECGYDAGDCCACTCEDTRDYICGEYAAFQCIDPDAPCVDDDDITVDQVENCGLIEDVGDALCNTENNNALCGYDGGDCCSCTCEDTEDYTCGEYGFQCIDPDAPCVDDDDITVDQVEHCGDVRNIGNSFCNTENNNALCGYDGGDCCECTCTTMADYSDDNGGCSSGFQCIDPDAPCVDDDDITVDQVENCGYMEGLDDGHCDTDNNNALCGYDGGDCCECTCTQTYDDYDDEYYGCDDFQCIDPDAPCVDDDDITVDQVGNCGDAGSMGNGYCDTDNNNALCGYDGGDCCECTCTQTYDDYHDEYYGCEDFQCIDPDAPCVDDDDITVDMLENCWVYGIGDGQCNEENNIPECNYDGGDCCECTCVPPAWTEELPFSYAPYICGSGYSCIDPNAPCVNDDDVTVDLLEICDTVSMSNAYCDEDNNRPECNYDGGDCCSCTCEDTPMQKCGQHGGFACIDPDALCVDDDDITVDMLENCAWAVDIGNGYCDERNNIAACNYDGGDCCECTCVRDNDDDGGCGRYSDFACVDPMAPCVDDDSVTVDMLDICEAGRIGNGYCDDNNNVPECAYDGGDCCECTCDPSAPGGGDDNGCQSGFACVDPSAPCVNDDDITVDMLENCDYAVGIGNGYCDLDMNIPECNYDGGDCCECTCEVSHPDDNFPDGPFAGCNDFACIDPEAPCVDEDIVTIDMIENCDYVLGIGNGYCERENNNELCAYDGGDCCSCTCEYEYDDDYACNADGSGFHCKDPSAPCFGEEASESSDGDDSESSDGDDSESSDSDSESSDGDSDSSDVDEPLPTVDGAVEVGTKTEVGVTATAYDVRPGASGNEGGCGEDGCAPARSRDGIVGEIESRWSCAAKLVEDEGPCQIVYTFAEPQDIVDIQVAFWKGNERTRTLEVHLDGMRTHTHESYVGSTFNTIGVSATGVSTVMLESIDLEPDEWISLLEVLIFVTP